MTFDTSSDRPPDIFAAHVLTRDEKIKTLTCVDQQKDIQDMKSSVDVTPISPDGFTIVRSRRLRRPTNSLPRNYFVRQLTTDATISPVNFVRQLTTDATISPVKFYRVTPPKT